MVTSGAMAHQEQQDYCLKIAARFADAFQDPLALILDCGSLDLNGNNRHLFVSPYYTGIDLDFGPNVDVVSPIHKYWGKTGHFDIIVSTECLEHDQHWRESLKNMVRMLKPGGIMLITCATTGRPEHGTRRCHPESSPFTNDYYQNLTADDFRDAISMGLFAEHEFDTNPVSCDLYFWGVKAS